MTHIFETTVATCCYCYGHKVTLVASEVPVRKAAVGCRLHSCYRCWRFGGAPTLSASIRPSARTRLPGAPRLAQQVAFRNTHQIAYPVDFTHFFSVFVLLTRWFATGMKHPFDNLDHCEASSPVTGMQPVVARFANTSRARTFYPGFITDDVQLCHQCM